MATTDGTGYPLFGYDYNAAGFYREPTQINNAEELKTYMLTVVKTALREKREIRITNTLSLIHWTNSSFMPRAERSY